MKHMLQIVLLSILFTSLGCGPKATYDQNPPSPSTPIGITQSEFITGLNNLMKLHFESIDSVLTSPGILSRTEQIKILLNIGTKDHTTFKSFIIRKTDRSALDSVFANHVFSTKFGDIKQILADAKTKNIPVDFYIFLKVLNGRFYTAFKNSLGSGIDGPIEKNNFEAYAKHKFKLFLQQPYQKQLDENGNFLD